MFRPAQPLAAARRVVAAHPDETALVAILLVGAALRLAFCPRAPIFTHGDSQQYYEPARALLDGRGFDLAYKRAPLYSAFIALLTLLLGPSLHGLIAVQHTLGLGTAVTVCLPRERPRQDSQVSPS